MDFCLRGWKLCALNCFVCCALWLCAHQYSSPNAAYVLCALTIYARARTCVCVCNDAVFSATAVAAAAAAVFSRVMCAFHYCHFPFANDSIQFRNASEKCCDRDSDHTHALANILHFHKQPGCHARLKPCMCTLCHCTASWIHCAVSAIHLNYLLVCSGGMCVRGCARARFDVGIFVVLIRFSLWRVRAPSIIPSNFTRMHFVIML